MPHKSKGSKNAGYANNDKVEFGIAKNHGSFNCIDNYVTPALKACEDKDKSPNCWVDGWSNPPNCVPQL